MKTPKQEALELLDRLPDDITYETMLAEILFTVQVMERSERADRGGVVSHEEAEKKAVEVARPEWSVEAQADVECIGVGRHDVEAP